MFDMYLVVVALLRFNAVFITAVNSLVPTPSGFGSQICKRWPNFSLQDINPSSKRKYLDYYGLSDLDPKPDVTIVGLYYADDPICQENVGYQQLLKKEIESKTDWVVSSVVINNFTPYHCLMSQKGETYRPSSSSSSSSSSSTNVWWWWSSWYGEDLCYNYIGVCAPDDERLEFKAWTTTFLSSGLTLPVFQDSEWSDVWDGFGGSRGDLFIYDAYGRLYEYYCAEDSLQYYISSSKSMRCNKSIADGGLRLDKNFQAVMSTILAATSSRYNRCADFVDDDVYDSDDNNNHNVDSTTSPTISPMLLSSSKLSRSVDASNNNKMSTTITSATKKPVTIQGKGSNEGGGDDTHFKVSSLTKSSIRFRKRRNSLQTTNTTATSHHWSSGVLLASVLSFCIVASAAIYLFVRWRKSQLQRDHVSAAMMSRFHTRDNMAFTQLPTSDDHDDEEVEYGKVSGNTGTFNGYCASDSNNTSSNSNNSKSNVVYSYDGDSEYDGSDAAVLRSSYHYGTPIRQTRSNSNSNNVTITRRGIMNSVGSSMSETDGNDTDDGTYSPLPASVTTSMMTSSSSSQQYYFPPPSAGKSVIAGSSASSSSSSSSSSNGMNRSAGTKNKGYNSLGTTNDHINSSNNNYSNNNNISSGGTDLLAGYATL